MNYTTNIFFDVPNIDSIIMYQKRITHQSFSHLSSHVYWSSNIIFCLYILYMRNWYYYFNTWTSRMNMMSHGFLVIARKIRPFFIFWEIWHYFFLSARLEREVRFHLFRGRQFHHCTPLILQIFYTFLYR